MEMVKERSVSVPSLRRVKTSEWVSDDPTMKETGEGEGEGEGEVEVGVELDVEVEGVLIVS